jgi:hypothetical protein
MPDPFRPWAVALFLNRFNLSSAFSVLETNQQQGEKSGQPLIVLDLSKEDAVLKTDFATVRNKVIHLDRF